MNMYLANIDLIIHGSAPHELLLWEKDQIFRHEIGQLQSLTTADLVHEAAHYFRDLTARPVVSGRPRPQPVISGSPLKRNDIHDTAIIPPRLSRKQPHLGKKEK